MKKILSIILAILVMAVIAGMLLLNNIKTRALPDYNMDIALKGLSEEVTVYRDSSGIPHIFSKNDLDLCRVTGYVMAQDRLWQMDLLRRVTTGRLSEVLDPGLVVEDQFFRSLRLTQKSEMIMSMADPALMACLEAFADGVNQYIEANEKKLPFEFAMLGYKPDPWLPLHSFNFIGYMNWTLASGWKEEQALFALSAVVDSSRLQELIPDMDLQKTYVYPDEAVAEQALDFGSHMDRAIDFIEEQGLQIFHASNNWAVSGTRSKSGMPLLSNDMHLEFRSPGIWYQMHQVLEDSFNITGVALPCSPFIVAGHNEDIAWGFTNLYVDDTDFYLETVNPEDSNQYLLDGQWKDMILVEEAIPLKGSEEAAIRVNRFTHRGPVLSGQKGKGEHVLSMHWQGSEFSNEYRSLYMLRDAGNWDEFRDALSSFHIGQNTAYADRYGNIGMQTVAAVPIRKGSAISIYPGDTSLYDWTGKVPFDELPSIFNPECGHVSSANNRTIGDDYPYYVGTWYDVPERVERIREMIEAREKLCISDFREMLKDQNSMLARKFNPFFLQALKGRTEGIYTAALKELEVWDYEMRVDAAAPMIFDLSYLELYRELVSDEFEANEELMKTTKRLARHFLDGVRVRGESAWSDNVLTPDIKESLQDNILAAFQAAVDSISKQFGDDPASWKWGDLHKLSIDHPMGSVAIVEKLFKVNRGPFPVGGSFHTVSPYAYPQGSFIANHGASQRHIYNTANWDASLSVIPTGTSGIPASEHYMDQTEMYLSNTYHRDLFSKEAVESNYKYRAVFKTKSGR